MENYFLQTYGVGKFAFFHSDYFPYMLLKHMKIYQSCAALISLMLTKPLASMTSISPERGQFPYTLLEGMSQIAGGKDNTIY